MKDNEKEINSVLRSCLTGYSIYDDSIIDCITKENRSLLNALTRKDWLRSLCDIITMAYTDGQAITDKKIESATKAVEDDDEDEKVKFDNLIGRDLYRQMKRMNRKEFSDFLFDLYNRIYNEREAQLKPDYEKIRSEVLKISGVGNVKADRIMEVLEMCLENKEGDS